jgi:hypothetical protein
VLLKKRKGKSCMVLEIPRVHFLLSLFHSTSRELKEQRKFRTVKCALISVGKK